MVNDCLHYKTCLTNPLCLLSFINSVRSNTSDMGCKIVIYCIHGNR